MKVQLRYASHQETIDLPESECKERRADLGEYSPVVTFSAIERALNRRNLHPLGISIPA